jgi:hypothetical protein
MALEMAPSLFLSISLTHAILTRSSLLSLLFSGARPHPPPSPLPALLGLAFAFEAEELGRLSGAAMRGTMG